jgi:thioredoxin-related protein
MKKYLFLFIVLTVQSIAAQAQTPEAAKDAFAAACKQAGKTGKTVFVMFHASWCGWCHKMDASMNDSTCKPFFDKNYVILHLVVQESKDKKNLENPGAEDLMNANGGKGQGLPYWFVAGKDGKMLASSRMPAANSDLPGDNVGCPAEANEIAHFINVLKLTSKLTAAEQAAIEKRFAQNKGH